MNGAFHVGITGDAEFETGSRVADADVAIAMDAYEITTGALGYIHVHSQYQRGISPCGACGGAIGGDRQALAIVRGKAEVA